VNAFHRHQAPWPKGLPGQTYFSPKLKGGRTESTHSTKCWHLHCQPEKALTNSYRVPNTHHQCHGLECSLSPRTWLKVQRSFFSTVTYGGFFGPLMIFFGVLYSSIIFHLFIPSGDMICIIYNGSISENKKFKEKIK
jgi:hypothetical protein